MDQTFSSQQRDADGEVDEMLYQGLLGLEGLRAVRADETISEVLYPDFMGAGRILTWYNLDRKSCKIWGSRINRHGGFVSSVDSKSNQLGFCVSHPATVSLNVKTKALFESQTRLSFGGSGHSLSLENSHFTPRRHQTHQIVRVRVGEIQ